MPDDPKLTDDEQALFDFVGTLSIFGQPQPAFRQLTIALRQPQERVLAAVKGLQRRGLLGPCFPLRYRRMLS